MTEKKKIAMTLKEILENPLMQTIMDKGKFLGHVVEQVNSWWRYDIYSRSPGPAYLDENFIGTDLDLSCFLYELAMRNAVINIPTYKSIRPKSIKEGRTVISQENRHGQIVNLTANRDVFLFSLRIRDANVVSSDKVGFHKNFSITDLGGEWYNGWSNLEFIPNLDENKFLHEHEIITGNNIQFKNFVHPNRWSSLFGNHYFITKSLISRLKEESTYYNQEVKKMLEEGITYPPKDNPTDGWPETTQEDGKKIKVKSFEVELDIPSNDSSFPSIEHNQENLIEYTKRRKELTYKIVPTLNFAIRTVEYAYYKYGNDRIPHWIKNTTWENNYVVPGKRNKWDRLVLFQPGVGEIGVSLRKRIYETSQNVALDYEEIKGDSKNYSPVVLKGV
jgi:hypothetical protein